MYDFHSDCEDLIFLQLQLVQPSLRTITTTAKLLTLLIGYVTKNLQILLRSI